MNEKQDSLELENQIVYFKSSERMEELEDESFDVIITSPPYNRGKRYTSDFGEVHDDKLPEIEYLEFLKRVWLDCHRVARQSAVLFLNIGDAAGDQGKSEKVVHSAELAGWIRIQDITWLKTFLGKGHYTPSGRDKRLNNIWEHIFLLAKDKSAYTLDPKAIGIPYVDKSNIGRYSETDLRDAGNAWLIPYEKTTGATIKKGHDAPFPIGLPYRCLKLIPNAKTVLDPFGGTCTTLAACLYLGLSGVAYERYPRIEIIKNRILEGKSFQPLELPLIPHLELALHELTALLSEQSFPISKSKTKKGFLKLQIIRDSCKVLEIENAFTKELDEYLSNWDVDMRESQPRKKKAQQKKLSSLLQD